MDIKKLTRQKLENISFDKCHTTYVGNKTLICRVLSKYIFFCDAEDTNIVPHLALQGYWETWITLAIAKAVQLGWRCIDIGANHGYYSVIMGDAVGSFGKVVAVEPNPKLAKLLKQTIESNGFQENTTILQKAALDVDAQKIKLVLPDGRGLNASVNLHQTLLEEDHNSFEVETMTIDTLTADWPSVDFIKIDAEGAEEKIWEGMTETISRNQNIRILLEFNCQRYANPTRFLEDIEASGFKLRYVDYDASIQDLTIERCLKKMSDGDIMLWLCKG
jgi:FkbM family methyltransferase